MTNLDLIHELQDLHWDSCHDIIVEIGSEREHGSTSWLANLAQKKQVDFYSIDISDDTLVSWSGPPVNFVIDKGSTWCRKTLPGLRKRIKVLMLDNYDWNYDVIKPWPQQHFDMVRDPAWPTCESWSQYHALPEWIRIECENLHGFDVRNTRSRCYYQLQAQWYLERNIEVNNRDCVREHLDQMLACLPFMCEDSVVICDDTFISAHYDIWTGKCAAVVPLLQCHGYQCISHQSQGTAWRRRQETL